MYTIYCSFSRYDEICVALKQLDIDEVVQITPVEWLKHNTVSVRISKDAEQYWDVDSQSPLQGALN